LACPHRIITQWQGLSPFIADVVAKIVNGHPNSRLDELLPWPYPVTADVSDLV
jgi:hypothetical protein